MRRRDFVLVGIAYGILGGILLGLALIVASRTFARPLVAKCDQDQNSVINSADLAAIAAAWGTPAGDVNLDGVTNSADLAGCAQAFNRWSYPDDPAQYPDDNNPPPPVDSEGLTLEEQTATALAGICPECAPQPTVQATPTP